MITTAELTYTLTLALIVLLLAAAYGFRLAVKGRAHFDRIDRQGGSRLLSKGAMELGYWILEPVAKLLVWIRVTPDEVSLASLGFGFLAAACLAVGHFGFGAIFATISGLLDSVDGMVARMSGVASDAGEILDAVVDRYVEFFFLSALVIYYREILILQAAALLALLGSFMVTYSTSKAEALGLTPPRGSMRRPERAVYLTLGAALSTVSIPLFEPPAESSNPIGYPMVVALVLVAVAANVSSIRRFWSIAKAVRVREKDFVGGKSSSEKFSIEEHEAAATSHDATGARL